MPRGDEVPHPSGWTMHFSSRQAESGWKSVVQQAPGNAADAWEAMIGNPRKTTSRQHRLKGSLKSGQRNGVTLDQWQYEVTGGGRLWYLIDDRNHIIWLVVATLSHPKATQ